MLLTYVRFFFLSRLLSCHTCHTLPPLLCRLLNWHSWTQNNMLFWTHILCFHLVVSLTLEKVSRWHSCCLSQPPLTNFCSCFELLVSDYIHTLAVTYAVCCHSPLVSPATCFIGLRTCALFLHVGKVCTKQSTGKETYYLWLFACGRSTITQIKLIICSFSSVNCELHWIVGLLNEKKSRR